MRSLEKPVLKPLPIDRYVFAEWKTPRVNIDYHIEVDHHYYSVPYQLIHEKVEVRLTATTVEVFLKGRRVASHLRSSLPGRHTTLPEHMPKSHQKYLQWTPSRLIQWAGTIGPQTQKLRFHLGESSSSGAGVPVLFGRLALAETIYPRTSGGRLCPSSGLQGLLLQKRRIHPQEWIGSTTFSCLFTPKPSASVGA